MKIFFRIKDRWLLVRKYCWFFVPFCRILLFGMSAYGATETLVTSNDVRIVSGIDGGSEYTIEACAGTSICFDVFSALPETKENLILEWNRNIPDAIFTSEASVNPSGHFCWSVPLDAGRAEAYSFDVNVMQANNSHIVLHTYTYSIFVPRLTINPTTKPSFCSGKDNGSISLNVSGGRSPYSYEWSCGKSTSMIEHLPAGNFTVEVTDDNGCTSSQSINVPVESHIEMNATSTPASCHSQDGSVTLDISGGLPPYSIFWNRTELNSDHLNKLATGTYTAEVTDSKGCRSTASVFVDDLSPKITITSLRPVQCKGGSDGMIYVEGTGRSALVYSWEPNHEMGPRLKDLTSGTYTVTATDEQGCSTQLSTEVSFVHTNPVVDLGSDRTVCNGEKILLDAGEFSAFQWTNNSSARITEAGQSDTYSVTVTDLNGCQSVDAIRLDFVDCSKLDDISSISVYPSPVRDMATLSLSNGNEESTLFEIHDLLGKLVWQKEIRKQGEIREEIPTCTWSNGMYVLRVIKNGRISTRKFMKQ